eukprot:gene6020-5327_t
MHTAANQGEKRGGENEVALETTGVTSIETQACKSGEVALYPPVFQLICDTGLQIKVRWLGTTAVPAHMRHRLANQDADTEACKSDEVAGTRRCEASQFCDSGLQVPACNQGEVSLDHGSLYRICDAGFISGLQIKVRWLGTTAVQLISAIILPIKVGLSFHSSSEATPLPSWVLAGGRCGECITLGIDDLPVLRGRTGMQIYEDFMLSFKNEFHPLLGILIMEVLVGLGPNGELKYPSHPTLDERWTFPGVGEFQCYDRFMSATLKACAEQVGQPSWGLGGPHDAGSYCMWPHQTGFFDQTGNWSSEYGKFFLHWYSEMLTRHANSVLESACHVFNGCPVPLAVRVPAAHWWYNTASHAPELTSGAQSPLATRRRFVQPFENVMARIPMRMHSTDG